MDEKEIFLDVLSFFSCRRESCNCAVWETHSKRLGNSAVFQYLVRVMFAPSVYDF